MVSPTIIDSSIDRFGEEVTLISKSSIVYSDYGDVSSQTTSGETIVAVLNDLQGDEQFNTEGRFRPGDKTFFCKSDTDNLTEGNTIVVNGETYEIKDVVNHRLQGNDFAKEVRTNKV